MRWTAVALLLLWPVAPAVAQPIFSPTQDPLAGSRVFGTKGCMKCHAVNGIGGKIGPDLGRVPRPRSFYELAAEMWNHLPKMAERMRQIGIARPSLDPRETGDLISFLFTLNYFDPPGNIENGRRLFAEKRCVVCHQVGGSGGVVGPNLDFLQQFGSPILIAAEMWNHGFIMAERAERQQVAWPRFRADEMAHVVTFLKSLRRAEER